MRPRDAKLVRKQLDDKLNDFKPLRDIMPPRQGWIRAIRDALGMTGEQLARRMGVNKQRVARIEQDEKTGAVTIKTMKRAAEALDCVFVYGFVPRTGLEQIVRERAAVVAKKQMDNVSHTMLLENQGLDNQSEEMVLADTTETIIETWSSHLWDEE